MVKLSIGLKKNTKKRPSKTVWAILDGITILFSSYKCLSLWKIGIKLVRVTGIKPASSDWQPDA